MNPIQRSELIPSVTPSQKNQSSYFYLLSQNLVSHSQIRTLMQIPLELESHTRLRTLTFNQYLKINKKNNSIQNLKKK